MHRAGDRMEAALRLLNIGGVGDGAGRRLAGEAKGERQGGEAEEAPARHRPRRLPASQAEKREAALAAEERRAEETLAAVVSRGAWLGGADRRARMEKASMVHRAAGAARMIERYGEEMRADAMRRAATARMDVERLWAAEDDFAMLATGPTDERPGTVAEVRRARLLASTEAAACAGRCHMCDAGVLHGEATCEVTKSLRAPTELDPRTAWQRGLVHHGRAPSDVEATRDLLRLRSQSEVDAWTVDTPAHAKLAMQELVLTRKGLVRLPDPAMFHGVRVLKLSRNRVTELPEALGSHMPCLERLDASCNALETMPDSVGALMFLEHLDVSGNRLTSLHRSASGNRGLVRLDASNNRLTSLPEDLAECCALRELVVNCNPELSALPEDLGMYQPDLRGVWARGCGLLALPSGLDIATGLVDLDVGSNRLRELPEALGGAHQPNLRTLRAADNLLARLPSGLTEAVALQVLDVTHNALQDVDATRHTTALVELRASHNRIRCLPRDVAGGPRRLRLALGTGALGSTPPPPRTASAGGGTGGSSWSGLRVLHVANNLLEKLPSDLAATLVGCGHDAWSVEIHGNPLAPTLRRLLEAPEAVGGGVAGVLAHLSKIDADLDLLEPRTDERSRDKHAAEGPLAVFASGSATEARRADLALPATLAAAAARVREERRSLEAPAALGATDGIDSGRRTAATRRGGSRRRSVTFGGAPGNDALSAALAAERRRRMSFPLRMNGVVVEAPKETAGWQARRLARRARRHSVFDDAARARERLRASDPGVAAREAALVEQYTLRVEAARAVAAVNAKRTWGVARAKLAPNVGKAVEGLALRETLLETIARANEEKARQDEAEFRWIHDVAVFRLLPFANRVRLARACRRMFYSRGQTVCAQGDDADSAIIVALGRVQLSVTTADGLHRHDRVRHSVVGEITAGATAEAEAEEAGATPEEGRRWGADACVGLECLLTDAPRAWTMTVKSPETVVYEVPRADLAETLDALDARRAKAAAEARRHAAERARDEAKAAACLITEDELDDAAARALAAHDAASASNPPPPSEREQMLRFEARRQLEALAGYAEAEASERDALLESRLARVRAAARSVGLGPPEGRTHKIPALLGSGPDGSSNLDDEGVARFAQLRRVPLFAELTRAELRHIAAKGVRERVVDQGGKPLIVELDDSSSSMFIVVEGVGEVLKSRQPTKLDPDPKQVRVAKVKTGDVVGEICLLTGGKRTATVEASRSRKAPLKLRALEVPKQSLRAVVERRPTVIDAFAASIATRWVNDQVNAVGMTEAERALQELRLSHRVVESAVSHFRDARSAWAKAGGTTLATVRKRGLASALTKGGVGALVAAARGAPFMSDTSDMSDEACASLLLSAPLLATLHAAEARVIVARGVRRVVCPAGDVHVRQGDVGGSMYVVLSGMFEVLVTASGGSAPEVVGTMLPGEAFGEMSLLMGERRTASVRAAEDSQVLEVSRKGVEEVVKARPLLVDDFAKFIADRRRQRDEVDRTFAEDEASMAVWGAELHQSLVQTIQAWVLRGERGAALAEEADAENVGDRRVGRRRLAFGEASTKVLGLLLRVDLFSALDKTKLLVMLREGAFLETHPPGSKVVTQGEEGSSMYVVYSGKVAVDLERLGKGGLVGGESTRTALRELGRGDIFGETCMLTGAPRSASVTATYDGAKLIELTAAAISPILHNVKAFIPTAAAVLAARYLDREPAWDGMDPDAREDRLQLRAARLADSMRNYHGVAATDETDGRVTARKLMANVGLAGELDQEDEPLQLGRRRVSVHPDDEPSGGKTSRSVVTAASGGRRRLGEGILDGGVSRGGGGGAFDETVASGLRLHPFFSALSAREILAVGRRSQRFSVEMGQRVFRQADPGSSMFIIVKGIAIVFYEDSHGKRVKVDELTEGQSIGETSLLLGEPRPATIVASPPGIEVIEIGSDALRPVLLARPMLEDVIDDLVMRRRLERQYDDVLF